MPTAKKNVIILNNLASDNLATIIIVPPSSKNNERRNQPKITQKTTKDIVANANKIINDYIHKKPKTTSSSAKTLHNCKNQSSVAAVCFGVLCTISLALILICIFKAVECAFLA